MLGLLIHPLVLMLLMYLLAKHDADLNFLKIFLICLVISILVFIASFFIKFLALLIYLLILPWALVHFCYLRWKIAFLVVGIFFAWQIVYVVGWQLVSR